MSQYNSYDKITLITYSVYHFNHDYECEEVYDNNGKRMHLKHSQTGLSIFINYEKNTTMLTFSSKALKARALELISTDTIQVVYEAIARVLDINYPDFMQATVLKVEVTKDITYLKPEELIESLFKLTQLQTGYKAPRRFYKHAGKACSFGLKRNNNNRKYVDYLSVYDKGAEYQKQATHSNCDFIRSLSSEELIQFQNDLKDVVRFEVKLHSAYMIRRHFMLGKNVTPTLEMLFISDVPVVRNMVESIFKGVVDFRGKDYKPKNMTQLSYYLALKENRFDVESTIAYLKHLFGDVKRSRVTKKLGEVLIAVTLAQYGSLVEVYNRIISSM